MIQDAIYSILDASSIEASPDVAPEGLALPQVVYQIVATTPDDHKDGVSILDVIRVQIDIMDDNPRDCKTKADSVRTALDRYKGTVGGEQIQSIRFDGEGTIFEEDPRVFRITQDYVIRHIR